ncbi:hypothetical protein BDP27DRAFT_1492445 [Rhodocollybia butyracea]|uniref:Uncharacterized protein n=1 Tax=Rhodocollybia butyracea TaxID=206335 RepID=A0A9P5U0J6_9AGAR|nr:hypothetical protein BDP27DRAFT_1492445 [Rhodocollybia butyracea]
MERLCADSSRAENPSIHDLYSRFTQIATDAGNNATEKKDTEFRKSLDKFEDICLETFGDDPNLHDRVQKYVKEITHVRSLVQSRKTISLTLKTQKIDGELEPYDEYRSLCSLIWYLTTNPDSEFKSFALMSHYYAGFRLGRVKWEDVEVLDMTNTFEKAMEKALEKGLVDDAQHWEIWALRSLRNRIIIDVPPPTEIQGGFEYLKNVWNLEKGDDFLLKSTVILISKKNCLPPEYTEENGSLMLWRAISLWQDARGRKALKAFFQDRVGFDGEEDCIFRARTISRSQNTEQKENVFGRQQTARRLLEDTSSPAKDACIPVTDHDKDTVDAIGSRSRKTSRRHDENPHTVTPQHVEQIALLGVGAFSEEKPSVGRWIVMADVLRNSNASDTAQGTDYQVSLRPEGSKSGDEDRIKHQIGIVTLPQLTMHPSKPEEGAICQEANTSTVQWRATKTLEIGNGDSTATTETDSYKDIDSGKGERSRPEGTSEDLNRVKHVSQREGWIAWGARKLRKIINRSD